MANTNGTGRSSGDGTPHEGEFDLFNQPPDGTDDEGAQGGKLTAAFLAFHAANPHVYDVLVSEARRWRATGREKYGIDMLFNRARWVLSIETTGEPFKLNDHDRSFYARLIMARESDLVGIFDLRRAAEADAWIASFDEDAA